MVSNKTLSAALTFVLLLSVFSTTFSLYKIGSYDDTPTGFASSQQGTATLTILSSTDITLDNATINFGTGVVNVTAGCDNATLHTNGSGVNQDNCWINSSVSPNEINALVDEKFGITNVGNVNVSITLTSSKGNASYFIGNATSGSNASYNFTVNDAEAGSCTSGIVQVWAAVNGSAQTLCSNLRFTDSSNFIEVPLLVRIPAQIDTTGQKNDTLTFTSAQS